METYIHTYLCTHMRKLSCLYLPCENTDFLQLLLLLLLIGMQIYIFFMIRFQDICFVTFLIMFCLEETLQNLLA